MTPEWCHRRSTRRASTRDRPPSAWIGNHRAGAVPQVELLLSKALPPHVPGALWLCALGIAGAVYCMRFRLGGEVTEGEVPTTFHLYHGEPATVGAPRDDAGFAQGAEGVAACGRQAAGAIAQTIRQPLGRAVVAGLLGNATIRVPTGFPLYIAFYAKAQGQQSGLMQLAAVGAVGGGGSRRKRTGNGLGTRVELKNPPPGSSSSPPPRAVPSLCSRRSSATCSARWRRVWSAPEMSAIGRYAWTPTIQGRPARTVPGPRRSGDRRRVRCSSAGCSGHASACCCPPRCRRLRGRRVTAIGTVQTILTTRGSTLVPGFGGNRPDYASPPGHCLVRPNPAGSPTARSPTPWSPTPGHHPVPPHTDRRGRPDVILGQLRSRALAIIVGWLWPSRIVGGTVAFHRRFTGHDEPPKASLAVGGTLTRIEPARWCSLDPTECTPARMQDMVVPPRRWRSANRWCCWCRRRSPNVRGTWSPNT